MWGQTKLGMGFGLRGRVVLFRPQSVTESCQTLLPRLGIISLRVLVGLEEGDLGRQDGCPGGASVGSRAAGVSIVSARVLSLCVFGIN